MYIARKYQGIAREMDAPTPPVGGGLDSLYRDGDRDSSPDYDNNSKKQQNQYYEILPDIYEPRKIPDDPDKELRSNEITTEFPYEIPNKEIKEMDYEKFDIPFIDEIPDEIPDINEADRRAIDNQIRDLDEGLSR